MKLSKDYIEINTLNAFIAFAASLVLLGLYVGAIKSDIASAQQTNEEQTKSIDAIEDQMITKREFEEFKKTNDKMVELIRIAYPKY